ncbi:MAG: hypothetical protein KJO21_11200 [Verrucomicrobiae bacterium]|nr:hypothetical protein [Verrucomicrobiae bacterium]NNJ42853.1 hypothetical protein [Akkermansiaceae bacterium]
MLADHQRRLEIGSHQERLDTVRELGDIDSRESYALLCLAAEDIDRQIQETAQQLMRNSCWFSSASLPPPSTSESGDCQTESLF